MNLLIVREMKTYCDMCMILLEKCLVIPCKSMTLYIPGKSLILAQLYINSK